MSPGFSGLEDAFSILWSDLKALRRSIVRYLIATVVSPVLYMAAFGFGLGTNIRVDGLSYLEFVIPGIIALTAMNTSFNGAGTRLIIDQIHYRSFDESIMAPVSSGSLLLGKALIGVFRGLVSCAAFIAVAFLIWPQIHIGPLFLFCLLITCLAFSFLGVASALMAKSYEDMTTFTSLFIIPMTFLSGTFFSLSSIPSALRYVLYLSPLTHSSICLRAFALGETAPWTSVFALLGFCIVFSAGSVFALKRKDA